MDIRKLVEVSTNNRMDSSPGCYSGRGATTSDLNSIFLNQIADAIKEAYGDHAHDNYVTMVWAMPSLSATAFLNNLYALERAGWNLSKADIKNDDKSFESEGEAMGLLLETITRIHGNKRPDETNSIRSGFRTLK